MQKKIKQVFIDTLSLLDNLYVKQGLAVGEIEKIIVKPQWNVVIGSHGQSGMSLNFTGIHDLYSKDQWLLDELKIYLGQNLFQVAQQLLDSPEITDLSIGVTALSALSRPFLSPDSLAERGIYILGDMESVRGLVLEEDCVTMVGYGGLLRPLLGRTKELHVTEMRPMELFQSIVIGEEIEYVPKVVQVHAAEENRKILSSSDVAILTASSFVYDTFDDLWDYSSSARLIGVYGPSVSFIPDVLFDSGIDFVFSFWTSDLGSFVFDAVNC